MSNMEIRNDHYTKLYEVLGNQSTFNMETMARQIDADKNASIMKYNLKKIVGEDRRKYA